ncbi:MAG TPA: integrin alpha, partial [Candidatus Deferrimicrobium sp.]|nr:integrin alpha [Candidatus Deferrimicrobium sp.]
AASSFYGQALASAGDFNGDTCEDLLVGAPFYDLPATSAGAAYLYYGGPVPDTSVDHIFSGAVGSDYYGIAVSSAGDFNNDSFDDIVIGAYQADWGSFSNSGKAYVYYGGPAPNFVVDKILIGQADGERFGYALTSGKVNGDGSSDIAVGAYSYDSSGINQGRIYLFYGGVSPDTLIDLIVTGDSAGYKFGWSLATGRVSNDAAPDMIMGTDGYSMNAFAAGKLYVFFGGAGFDNNEDYSYTLGRLQDDFLGDAVASAVDIGEDGFDEMITGMPGNDDGASNAGGSILFSGGAVIAPDTSILGNGTDEEMGESVVLWKGYGSADAYVFAAGASAYDSFRGRIALYRKPSSASCCVHRGNVDGVIGPAGPVDVSDLTFLVAFLFSGGTTPPCVDEGNVDGVIGPAGPIDVSDLTYLVAFLFSGGAAPPPCA